MSKVDTTVSKCIIKNINNAKKQNLLNGETPIYSFPDWDDNANIEWLKENENKLVCILSVSLARSIDSTYEFSRYNLLHKCVKSWIDNGFSVLVFFPLKNVNEYKFCFKNLNPSFQKKMRFAAYSNPTCDWNMVVGESRNSILHFVKKFKHIFRTCTVSDERIYDLSYGVLSVSKLKKTLTKEKQNKLDKIRWKYGYGIFKLVKKFLSNDNKGRKLMKKEFESMQKNFNKDIKEFKLKKSTWKQGDSNEPSLFKADIYSTSGPNLYDSLLNRTERNKYLTMVGVASARACSFHFKRSQHPIRENEIDTMDLADAFSEMSLVSDKKNWRSEEKIAQLICFRTGGVDKWANTQGYGWHGQFYYPKTKLWEDNYFSYEWDASKTAGTVAELDCLCVRRQKSSVSIARRPVDVSKMTDCALKELCMVIDSGTCVLTKNGVGMKWTTHSEPIIISSPEGGWKIDNRKPQEGPYYHMAHLMRDVASECIRRKIPVSDKVKQVCKALIQSKALNKSKVKFFYDNNRNQHVDMDELTNEELQDEIEKVEHDILNDIAENLEKSVFTTTYNQDPKLQGAFFNQNLYKFDKNVYSDKNERKSYLQNIKKIKKAREQESSGESSGESSVESSEESSGESSDELVELTKNMSLNKYKVNEKVWGKYGKRWYKVTIMEIMSDNQYDVKFYTGELYVLHESDIKKLSDVLPRKKSNNVPNKKSNNLKF